MGTESSHIAAVAMPRRSMSVLSAADNWKATACWQGPCLYGNVDGRPCPGMPVALPRRVQAVQQRVALHGRALSAAPRPVLVLLPPAPDACARLLSSHLLGMLQRCQPGTQHPDSSMHARLADGLPPYV